ncbi:MAG: hypothetical protein DBP02_01265 [gamma proteobacterium symbiont of Ctena orbiculata]|nr:MAG: hypothetical protein DBP02_01265 [gamma proteobacterium symbiont of Ctena orbiculata]
MSASCLLSPVCIPTLERGNEKTGVIEQRILYSRRYAFPRGAWERGRNHPPPEVLAQEIVEQLEAALEEFRNMEEILANGNGNGAG